MRHCDILLFGGISGPKEVDTIDNMLKAALIVLTQQFQLLTICALGG